MSTWTERPGGFLRPAEAAERLGLSVEQVRRMCKRGKIPCRIYDRTIRIDPAELEKFIAESSKPRAS